MRIQIVILSSLAMLWGLTAWAIAGASPAFAVLPLLATALLIFAGWKMLPPAELDRDEARRIRRLVRLWSAVEIAAIVLVGVVLQRNHQLHLMPAAISIIVGLHFLPLARGIPQKCYYATMAGLVLMGLIAPLLPLRFEMLFPLLAGAVILWGSAAGIILSRQRMAG